MSVISSNISPRRLAQTIGLSIIFMAILGGVVIGGLFDPLFIAAPTGGEIPIAPSLFAWGIAGWFAIFFLDLVVSGAVYQYYQPHHAFWAAASALFRLIYTAILGYCLLLLFYAQGEMTVASTNGWWARIIQFEKTWTFGLIIFGGHLALLAGLVNGKNWGTRILQILLLLAGVGYIIIHAAPWIPALMPLQETLANIFIFPMIAGELGWGIALLFGFDRR
ncbi:MAG: DUF4386 domain-containing protein [Bacteroidota bacterium]